MVERVVTSSYEQNIPDMDSRNLLVIACTRHYFGEQYVQDFCLPDSWNLTMTCRFSTDVSLIDQADALWFHGPSIRKLPRKKAGQKWIISSMESDSNYPFLKNPEAMGLFDLNMTYRLDSDIPCIYPNWQTYGSFMDAPVSLASKDAQSAQVSYIASNPVSQRDDYVAELMKYISVDSLGQCLNNKTIENFDASAGAWRRSGAPGVVATIRGYKFHLAFENSIAEDYVTERALLALSCGTVPVYLGAPNITEFLPGEHCIVNVNEFEDPRTLANYLSELGTDDLAYLQYLEWKDRELPDTFRSLVDIGSIDPRYRMAIKLLHECDAFCSCGGRIRL